jgi:hypothetical protein
MTATLSPTLERRVHVRFPARELSGLRAARVKYGQPIDVIDLSAGGVLFETAASLTHEATIVLEFAGPAKNVLIPSRVVRVQTLRTADYSIRSQGACVFKRPLGLKELVTGTGTTDREVRPPDDHGTGAGTWLPVIGKCRDGRLISGYTDDFSPAKSYLHVSPRPSSAGSQVIELAELDAIFFLREPTDTADADRSRSSATPYGRKVALMLPSGEQITGSTLNYSRHSAGVFVYPFGSDFGVTRVFVTQNGTRNIKLL